MKRNIFYALVSIKTPDGFESFGKFNLGNSRKAAANIFQQMKGTPQVDRKTMLTIELVETVNELPVNLHILACTLEELAYNCRIITKEAFKLHNLKYT